jgi:hypothetical protein
MLEVAIAAKNGEVEPVGKLNCTRPLLPVSWQVLQIHAQPGISIDPNVTVGNGVHRASDGFLTVSSSCK